jgi:hypothetical protein
MLEPIERGGAVVVKLWRGRNSASAAGILRDARARDRKTSRPTGPAGRSRARRHLDVAQPRKSEEGELNTYGSTVVGSR